MNQLYSIIDITEKVVLQQSKPINQGRCSINLSDIRPGAYTVKIVDETQNVSSKMVIIAR